MDSKRTPGAARGADPSGPRTGRPDTATRRWRLRRVLCLLLLCGGAVTSIEAADPQPYRVEFASTGNAALDATLKATSQLEALRSAAPVSPLGLLARARADIGRLKTALESAGYYQSSVAVTINGAPLEEPSLGATLGELPAGAEALCKIAFSLGPQYHLGHIDIEGELPDAARPSLGLSTGEPAVASEVLAGGARLLTALQNHGYAFAKVDPPLADEDPQQHVLNLNFHVVTGPHVQIGEIDLEGLKTVHERLVRRRLLLRTGQDYSAMAVESARRDLLTLGVFAAVSVRLGEAPDQQGRVPVTFRLRERPLHAVSLSAGYSSDLGGSAGVAWSDRNLRGNAEQLTVSAKVINLGGTATTGIGYDNSVKYLLPEFAHRDQSLQFAVGALKQALQAYDQTAETSGVTLTRKINSIWSASLGVSAVHETVIQEQSTRVYTLLALPLGLQYDSTGLLSPLLDPTHGVRASLSVAPTLSRGRPNTRFLVSQASVASYLDLQGLLRTKPGRSVLALRALGGSAVGAGEFLEPRNPKDPLCQSDPSSPECPKVSVPALPPDQRFYAGGSGTVRGYRYQSVGPQFLDGNPVGGSGMTAVNAEFRQRIATNFGAVVFVDAGEVSQSVSPFAALRHAQRCSPVTATSSATTCWAVGVGAGIRYYTPIGPIRLDLAVPTARSANDDRFEIYIGLGQAF
jgi:translocation and assembly module TamA